SNDFSPTRQFRSYLKAFSDGIFTGPVSAREFIVHDHSIGSLGVIALVELPALEKPNAHRAKILESNRAVIGARRLTSRHRFSLYGENDCCKSDHRHSERTGGRLDARQSLDLRQGTIEKLQVLLLLLVDSLRQSRGERQDISWIESRIDSKDAAEAAHHQSGAG